MTITAPVPGQSVSGTWTSNVTAVANGFLSNATTNQSSNLVCSTTFTDIPGLTASVSVAGSNAYALVAGSFDYKCVTASSGGWTTVQLLLDGVVQVGTCQFGLSVATIEVQGARIWKVNLSSGSHTLKFQASITGGACTIQAPYSNITVIVFDMP